MTKREITGFVIDLATVVIGIALTFGISELIQQRSHRREASRILAMVKEELGENLVEIEIQKGWLLDEQAGTIALRPYINDPESIPADTLRRHIHVLETIRYLGVETDAFEVFKQSPLIPHVRNKDLLREIFSVYSAMNKCVEQVGVYYTSVKREARDFLGTLDKETYLSFPTETEAMRERFAELTGNQAVRNYIVSTAQEDNPYGLEAQFDEIIAATRTVIATIDKEVRR